MSWITDESPDVPHVMWLSGGAGAGKSTIALTVADSIAMKGHLAGSFFCMRGDGPQSSAARVVPSVAYHLAVSNKTIRAYIEAAIMSNPLILTDKAIGVQLNELIRRPLENAGAPFTQVPSLIVLDGLDECGDSTTVQRLLFAIRDDVGIVGLPLRFLITSRPEFPIESFFRTMPQLHRHLHLGLSEEAGNDIRKYLLHGFSQIRTKHSDVFPQSTTWPLDDDINLLVHKASRHFLYASTVFKYVDHSDDHPKIHYVSYCWAMWLCALIVNLHIQTWMNRTLRYCVAWLFRSMTCCSAC